MACVKRVDMERDVSVQEVMDREFVGVTESDGFTETVELMLEEGVESVVVLRGTDPVGVVTERDALEALVAEQTPETAADAMTDTVPTVRPDHTIAEAADEMSAAATRRVLVSNGAEPVGVLSEHDLITTSPFAPALGTERMAAEAEPPEQESIAAAQAGPGDLGEGSARAQEYDEQSICEACSSLARDLRAFNGQLLCADCRDI